MKTVPATVFWVSPADGGRSNLPGGLEYSTVSKWPGETSVWSVVLHFAEPPSQANPTKAIVRFLVDNAHEGWLKPGEKFEIYEGRRKVADVEIDQEAL